MFKIDLHVHTKERSACGSSTEEAQIRAAMEAGLDAIVFSDHDRLAPQNRLQELNDKYAPFKVFGGIEVSIWDNRLFGFEHILVLGIQDTRLEKYTWSYPDLYKFVRECDGFLAVAHLFRFNPTSGLDLGKYPPDALEGHSNNISMKIEPKILSMAQKLDLPILSNSDAHHTSMIGQHYNTLSHEPSDDKDLIECLMSRQFTCVYPEPRHRLC